MAPPGRRCSRPWTTSRRKSTSETLSPHASLIRRPRPTRVSISGRYRSGVAVRTAVTSSSDRCTSRRRCADGGFSVSGRMCRPGAFTVRARGVLDERVRVGPPVFFGEFGEGTCDCLRIDVTARELRCRCRGEESLGVVLRSNVVPTPPHPTPRSVAAWISVAGVRLCLHGSGCERAIAIDHKFAQVENLRHRDAVHECASHGRDRGSRARRGCAASESRCRSPSSAGTQGCRRPPPQPGVLLRSVADRTPSPAGGR